MYKINGLPCVGAQPQFQVCNVYPCHESQEHHKWRVDTYTRDTTVVHCQLGIILYFVVGGKEVWHTGSRSSSSALSSHKARVVEVGLKMPKEDMVLPFRDMAHHPVNVSRVVSIGHHVQSQSSAVHLMESAEY